MNRIVTKLVKLNLAKQDGNAFFLIGAFRKAAKRQGIDAAEIEAVSEACMAGNYDHLLRVLISNTESED